jgi:hypothetical protein
MIWIFLLIFAVKLENIHLRGDMAAERRNNLATLRRCAAPHSLSLSAGAFLRGSRVRAEYSVGECY